MVKPKEHVLKQLVLHIYVCLLEGNQQKWSIPQQKDKVHISKPMKIGI